MTVSSPAESGLHQPAESHKAGTANTRSFHEQVILDHLRHPHHRGTLRTPTAAGTRVNPACGDEVHVMVAVIGGVVEQVAWEGRGCAVSQSSASMLATLVSGVPAPDCLGLISEFRKVLHAGGLQQLDVSRFGDAVALGGAARFTSRVRCALLAWDALEVALGITPHS